MPEDKVAIIKKDGTFVYYNTYGAARAASNPNSGDHDLIQIRANLNEEIHLKDGVDIWIMPGIVVDYNPSPPPSQPSATIADYTIACKCNIYGEGIIKSTFNSGMDKFNCSLHTKNYGLFGNKDIAANIVLDIGNLGNYIFVPSSDIT